MASGWNGWVNKVKPVEPKPAPAPEKSAEEKSLWLYNYLSSYAGKRSVSYWYVG